MLSYSDEEFVCKSFTALRPLRCVLILELRYGKSLETGGCDGVVQENRRRRRQSGPVRMVSLTTMYQPVSGLARFDDDRLVFVLMRFLSPLLQ
jgi:hypothetical protein